jgi:hypothetical protein
LFFIGDLNTTYTTTQFLYVNTQIKKPLILSAVRFVIFNQINGASDDGDDICKPALDSLDTLPH